MNFSKTQSRPSFHFWLLSGFLLLVFLTGGSARIDVQSLIILHPAAMLACACALITLRRSHFSGRKWVAIGFAAICLLPVLHIIPLPSAIWQNLPGREMQVEIDTVMKMGDVWRPISLTPDNTLHALASLSVPLAVFLLGVQLNRDDLFRLLPVLIALGAISGLFGLFQLAGSAKGPLYLYRITNEGAAVGLFANRNHAATLLACLFPLLACFASTGLTAPNKPHMRAILAMAIAIILVPLILVTGSRSGLVVAVIGIAAAPFLYAKPTAGRPVRTGKSRFQFKPVPILAGLALICLVFLSVVFSRATAFTRLFNESDFEAGRAEFWAASANIAAKYFPLGSGAGSFVEAYQIDEPSNLLYASYLNHAHNDYLEIVMTMGLAGIMLILAAVIGFAIVGWRVWSSANRASRAIRIAKTASIGLLIIALASFTDYPVRTPNMMAVVVLFVLWLTEWQRDGLKSAAQVRN
jgi:O-antigen ligase